MNSDIFRRCGPRAGPTPRPKEQSDFDLGGPKTELVYRVSERGCAAVQAREITGIHGSCLEYKLNQGGRSRREKSAPKVKSKFCFDFNCPFRLYSRRRRTTRWHKATVRGESLYRMDSAGRLRGAVQPGAATSAAPLSCAARLELSSVERLPRLINLGE